MTNELHKTVLNERHKTLGAKMVEFAGWEMPLHYAGGILQEHLQTRKGAGLFDVSHMGRFLFRGNKVLDFLQHVLSNNAAALKAGLAQYTMIPDPAGGVIDDAYLYRFVEGEYLLVVNAANRQKDWEYFRSLLSDFGQVELIDQTKELAMLSLQGPLSKEIITKVIESGLLPEPRRNALSIVTIKGTPVLLSRTGYTGEPLCFELFIPAKDTLKIWDLLIQGGASPVGLGARDTLRLEAGLPLYGHELGRDPEGKIIPIFACPLAKFAVSFSPLKRDFVSKDALSRQYEAFKRIASADYSLIKDLPRTVVSLAVMGKSVARPGAKVFCASGSDEGKHVGYVTSGTMVPYWKDEGEALASRLTQEKAMRPICLALLDSNLREGDTVLIEIRDKKLPALIVPFHLRSEAPPFSRPIIFEPAAEITPPPVAPVVEKVRRLLEKTIENTVWRQTECINLIPSEQTASPMARLLSVMDPAFRYAEHKSVKAFKDAQVFYYQGTDFICEVENLLADELDRFLGCRQVESRAVMGFDIVHINLHKTFATPHGGGGPGAGPVGVCEKLTDYLPIAVVTKRPDGTYFLKYDRPKSIGYIAPFYGNFAVILRAYVYILMLGKEGVLRVSENAVLNANYLKEKLKPYFDLPFDCLCKHECVFSVSRQANNGVHALDIAKALIDRGFHPPTIYFPLTVPEALMIEPTETESKETLDAFIQAMIEIAQLAQSRPEELTSCPRTTVVGRLDETRAARYPDLVSVRA